MKDKIICLSLKEFWEKYPECEIGIEVLDWCTRKLRLSEADLSKTVYNRKLKFFESDISRVERGCDNIIYVEREQLREVFSDMRELDF